MNSQRTSGHRQIYAAVCVGCLCLVLSLATFASGGTTVYKSDDGSGQPVFTDQSTPESETIKVEDPITFPSEILQKDGDTFDYQGIQSESVPEPQTNYQTLLISSPMDQQSIRNNAGNLTVEVIVPRSVAPGDQLQLLLDSDPIAVYKGEPFELQNLDRGAHTLQLQINNLKSGQTLHSSPVIRFNMLRYSKLHKSAN